MKLRILLAEDHAMFRQALRLSLETDADIEIVAEAVDGANVLELVGESRPDVVCMDVSMPGVGGAEATRQLLAKYPDVKVIGLSCHVDPERVAEMIDAGALGYVVKMVAGEELIPAIRAVIQNQTYLSAELDVEAIAKLTAHASSVIK